MKNIQLTALSEDAGKRIDIFLSEKIRELTRSKIQRLIKESKVLIDGEGVSKNYKLSEGDSILVEDYENYFLKEDDIIAQDIDIKIVYEDDAIIAVSKKASMVTHPASGNRTHTLANALLYHFKDKNKSLLRAGIVHRLDKDTSGLIIAAKDEFVQYRLSELFRQRKVKKEYTALVYGKFDEKKGLIDMPIARSKSDRKKMAVAPDSRRDSITKFETIEEFKDCSLLRVFPETGRTHQIRVHLSYIGHPVIGDEKYGNKASDAIAHAIKLERHFLHASKISFVHPVSKKELLLVDELSADLKAALDALKK